MSAQLVFGDMVDSRIHVVSCYAPTRAAPREVKDTFFQELEAVLASVPLSKRYVVLGDFNARVGSELIEMTFGMGLESHMGMVMQAPSCCLSCYFIRHLCVTPGFRKGIFINGHGSIQSPNSRAALTM